MTVSPEAWLSLRSDGDDPQVVAVLDHQAGAVAAHGEPVQLARQLGDLPLAQVEPLQRGPRRVPVQLRAAFPEHSGDGLAQPGQAALDRAQSGVPGLGHGHADHAIGEAVRVYGHHRSFG